MIRALVPAVFAAFLALAIYLFFYLGGYKSVDIRRESRPALHLLFRTHLGAYFQINSTIHDVELWAEAHGLKCPQTFAEFLDNPEQVDEDRLRSRVGCVLDAKPSIALEGGVESLEYPAADYVVGRFTGSPAVGPWKVYPKIKQFIVDQRLRTSAPPIEIYAIHGADLETEYLFRLDGSTP